VGRGFPCLSLPVYGLFFYLVYCSHRILNRRRPKEQKPNFSLVVQNLNMT
jgi:hypothetical protein